MDEDCQNNGQYYSLSEHLVIKDVDTKIHKLFITNKLKFQENSKKNII